jgi:thiamine biosynthesis lipoprotein ApbE
LPAVVLAFLLPASQAYAQARLQTTRQNGQCQHNGGQALPNSQQQLNALRTAMRSSMRQLNTLQQTGQLTSAQLQAVNDLQSALQNALQQLSALQNVNSTSSQLQILAQQQAGPALQPRAAPTLDRR